MAKILTKQFSLKQVKENFDSWVYKPNKSYCSGVYDEIYEFDFSYPCFVHDGYYGGRVKLPDSVKKKLKNKNSAYINKQGKPTRFWADRRFHELMIEEVEKQAESYFDKVKGYSVSYRRYIGVRTIGWRFWSPGY